MKKAIPLAILTLAVLIAGIAGFAYLQATYVATFNYEHAHNLQVVDISGRQHGGKDTAIASVGASGSTQRFQKTQNLIVTYKGDDGYADGFASITPDSPKVTIQPEFSEAKNKEIAASIRGKIRTVILASYPTTEKYFKIQDCVLRDRAKWCVARLTFTGNKDTLNADNLIVLLESDGTNWTLKTKPDIILTTANYPDLPASVLSWANDI